MRGAEESAPEFLGKRLVVQCPSGRIAGVILNVEAYPSFVDEVHHGNKRTTRTEVLYGSGGHAYVYLIYGTWHLLGAVVNKRGFPDLVLIRGLVLDEGVSSAAKNLGKPDARTVDLTNAPGKICQCLGITRRLYGVDLTGTTVWLEDTGVAIPRDKVLRSQRIGISPKLAGAMTPLRFHLPNDLIFELLTARGALKLGKRSRASTRARPFRNRDHR